MKLLLDIPVPAIVAQRCAATFGGVYETQLEIYVFSG